MCKYQYNTYQYLLVILCHWINFKVLPKLRGIHSWINFNELLHPPWPVFSPGGSLVTWVATNVHDNERKRIQFFSSHVQLWRQNHWHKQTQNVISYSQKKIKWHYRSLISPLAIIPLKWPNNSCWHLVKCFWREYCHHDQSFIFV